MNTTTAHRFMNTSSGNRLQMARGSFASRGENLPCATPCAAGTRENRR